MPASWSAVKPDAQRTLDEQGPLILVTLGDEGGKRPIGQRQVGHRHTVRVDLDRRTDAAGCRELMDAGGCHAPILPAARAT